MLSTLLAIVVTQAPDAGVVAPLPPPEQLVHLSAGVELEAGALPSGFVESPGSTSAGGVDVMAGVRPMLGMRVGDDFSVRLGPLVRFRLIDTPPLQRSADVGGVVRGEDWDQLSDFGELLQVLRIGSDTSPFQLRAGPVHKKTLGLGHLLFRYSNHLDATVRPAAASAALAVGFMKAELFASDVLGARLFAGELTWDVGRTFSSDAMIHGRALVSFSLAHDFGAVRALARQPTLLDAEEPVDRSATLAHLDGSVVFLRSQALALMGLLGLGARANAARDLGFLAGVAADVRHAAVELSLRAELRKQAGGFRHGFFGAQYELARFSGVGLTQEPLNQERLPDAFSVFMEARLRVARAVTLDGSVEAFTFGRTDFDATALLVLLDERLVAEGRVGAVGLGQTPRWIGSVGLRVRVLASFYLLGAGGLVFFPGTDGLLARGVTVTAGLGLDLER